MTRLARHFGVELEGHSNERLVNRNIAGWDGVSDGSLYNRSGETRDCDSGCDSSGDLWNIVSRTYSVCPSCNGTHRIEITPSLFAVEVVSPKIIDTSEIDEVFEYLTSEGRHWSTDGTCGLHVHVDATDLDATKVRRVVMLNSMVEPLFFAMNDDARFDGRYCHAMNHMYESIINHGSSITERDMSYSIYGSSRRRRHVNKYESQRYYGLNLHAVFYIETLEFRYFMGGREADYVKNRVELCVKMVEFAATAAEEQLLVVIARLDRENTFAGRWAVLKEILGLGFDIQPHAERLFERSIRHLSNEGILDAVRVHSDRYRVATA